MPVSDGRGMQRRAPPAEATSNEHQASNGMRSMSISGARVRGAGPPSTHTHTIAIAITITITAIISNLNSRLSTGEFAEPWFGGLPYLPGSLARGPSVVQWVLGPGCVEQWPYIASNPAHTIRSRRETTYGQSNYIFRHEIHLLSLADEIPRPDLVKQSTHRSLGESLPHGCML